MSARRPGARQGAAPSAGAKTHGLGARVRQTETDRGGGAGGAGGTGTRTVSQGEQSSPETSNGRQLGGHGGGSTAPAATHDVATPWQRRTLSPSTQPTAGSVVGGAGSSFFSLPQQEPPPEQQQQPFCSVWATAQPHGLTATAAAPSVRTARGM